MPIRNHRKLSLWKHANPQQYGGLVEVSLRYTPVTGRLHTRYAPVRRSSAEYCYSLLPLDLHVLSLPLAFILSQDQTLHCKNCSFTFLDSSSCPPPYLNTAADTRYLFFSSVSNHSCFSTTFSTSLFFVESGCKDTTIFQTGKIFFQKFFLQSSKALKTNTNKRKIFFLSRRKAPPETTQCGLFFQKIARGEVKKSENWAKTIIYT